MGDIFRREAAANPEPFTGERLTSALDGQTQIEHYHRYLFARSLCAGLDVLDVASGEGYGSAQLAQVACSVVGVEYSETTVRSAATNFQRPNLRYVQGDARSLPLADACVDAVVSFETIEHFDGQEAFLSEIHRVLRPDGHLIISTPDRDIYSPSSAPPNEYHVRELSRIEFVGLLHRHFSHVELLLQRPLVGSALMPETATTADPLVFDRRGSTHFEACVAIPRAPYIVAIAANRPIPALPFSLFIERSDLDTDRIALAERTGQFDAARKMFEDAKAELDQTHALLTETYGAATQATMAAQATERARAATASRLEVLASETERAKAEAERAKAEAARRLATLETQVEDLTRELDRTRGSMRTFLRQYLPRLRKYLLRR
jgi:SAM-dependent methyltransferase